MDSHQVRASTQSRGPERGGGCKRSNFRLPRRASDRLSQRIRSTNPRPQDGLIRRHNPLYVILSGLWDSFRGSGAARPSTDVACF